MTRMEHLTCIQQLTMPQIAEPSALEQGFPIVEISQVAEQESWRKEINRPIYHIHKWWATRLGSIFRGVTLGALSKTNTNIWEKFYDFHQFSNKVVLDPFMGSGTTLGEAVKLGAKAIGCDINPVSTFLVRQEFSPVSELRLKAEFKQLEQNCASQIQKYYQTNDPYSIELIPVLYYFWVKEVETPDGELIPLFSRYVFSQNAYPKKKPNAQIICPKCWHINEGRYDSTELICHHCSNEFNPQQGPAKGQQVTSSQGISYRIKALLPSDGSPLKHHLYAILALRKNGEKVYLSPKEHDFALYAEAEARLNSEDLPLPYLKIRPGHNTDQARGYNYTYWHQFFNARQLLCLGLLLKSILQIKDETVQEQMLCLFSSTLEFNNMFCSFKGEGTGAVRHLFSNHILKPERTPLENSIWGTNKSSGTFSTLFDSRLIKAKRYLEQPFEIELEKDENGKMKGSKKTIASNPINITRVETWETFQNVNNGLLILNGNSSQLSIPNESVDAVITDPPYFDFIHYSELSDFFFAWLSPVLKNRYAWFNKADSFDKGEVQHKDPRIFAKQLSSVFLECWRVLKSEGILAFSFHHSRPEGWAAIYEALVNAGFVIVAAHPVHAELRASSPKTATKDPISLDAILVCKKKSYLDIYANNNDLFKKVDSLAQTLENAGLYLSSSDRFVILASQLLISLTHDKIDFDSMCKRIDETHRLYRSSNASHKLG